MSSSPSQRAAPATAHIQQNAHTLLAAANVLCSSICSTTPSHCRDLFSDPTSPSLVPSFLRCGGQLRFQDRYRTEIAVSARR